MHTMQTTRQRGFSLVELMIALLIGAILTSGVISVFITSKASYSVNNGLGQVQEAGRYALGIMQPILTMAGNTGCYHPPTDNDKLTSMLNSADQVYNLRHAVYGFEYTGTGISASYPATTAVAPVANNAGLWSPNLSTIVNNDIKTLAVKYSDVLMVHEMLANPTPATINDDDKSVTGTLTIAATNAPAMSAGMLMIASNCKQETIAFQATGVTSTTVTHVDPSGGTPGNALAPNSVTVSWPSFAINKGSVGQAQTYVFFIGKGVGGESSLYQASLITSGPNAGQLDTPKEMVPGVENMQVLYGVDTDSTMDFIPNLYETADQIETASTCPSNNLTAAVCYWDRVVSVRVALVVHSDANTIQQAPSTVTAFHMLGTSATDSFSYKPYVDKRLRRYFVQTFSLRNMLK